MTSSVSTEFKTTAPTTPMVYEVATSKTTNAQRPRMYAHWNGAYWGTPSFTIEGARPARGAQVGRKRTHPLAWRHIQETALHREIENLLAHKGPQTFETLHKLMLVQPETKDTTSAQLDDAIKTLIAARKLSCIECVLSNEIGQIFSAVTPPQPDERKGTEPDSRVEPLLAEPQHADLAMKVLKVMQHQSIMSHAQICNEVLKAYPDSFPNSWKIGPVLTEMIMAGLLMRALASGKRQLGYVLAVNATAKMKLSLPRRGTAHKGSVKQTVGLLFEHCRSLSKLDIAERLNHLFPRAVVPAYFIDEALDDLRALGVVKKQMIGDDLIFVAVTPTWQETHQAVAAELKAADAGTPAIAPTAADPVPEADLPTPDATGDLMALAKDQLLGAQGKDPLRVLMGSLIGGMLDVIGAEKAKAAAGGSDAQFFPSQDGLRIVQSGQEITLKADELDRLKELL